MKIRPMVKELTHEDVVTILSGFNSIGDYWCSFVDFDDVEHENARHNLELERVFEDEEICIEDVWAKMLMNGGSLALSLYDENHTVQLSFAQLPTAIEKAITEYGISLDVDDWDNEDCDIIVQCACFGEVIYG